MPELSAPYRLLTSIWREAASHSPLAETLPRIAAFVGRVLAADYVIVRRIDADVSRIETVAVEPLRPGTPPPFTRAALTTAEREMLGDWVREPLPRVLADDGSVAPRVAIGVARFSDAIAVPLGAGGILRGIFSIVARAPGRLSDAHLAFAGELAGPLTAALDNDAHVHEENRLREALEADRRALLQRLNRDDIAEEIVGADSGLRRVMERVGQVAPTDVPVLLLGETGTGKEVAARAIHAHSRRAAGPIIRVNCGAIPAGLIDSELFGHERGSFTGAVAMRKGWFERADGGTLFLDEIGELPADAQVRLLRILQDGTFERVGAQRSTSVDVRIVAATNRDLRQMVAQGAFRDDLWYRISVFPIEVPPLRDRPEDIPALASHFAARAGTRLAGVPLSLDPEDVEILVAYEWPGNVRELAAVIERAAVLGDGRRLRVAAALGRPRESATPRATRSTVIAPGEDLSTLDHAMARHIENVLQATRGRVEGPRGAAAILRINPHTLRARMRKLRIDWARFRLEPGS